MKKYGLFFVALCMTCSLAACGSKDNQIEKQEAAEQYCNETSGTLSLSGDLFICSYKDGSTCESSDFREGGCLTQEGQLSWKDFISEDCKVFNDGCNNCSKTDDGEAVCTEMACNTYSTPHCLDIETEDMRIAKCEDKAEYYLSLGLRDIEFSRENEEEGGANFTRNGEITYTKKDGKAKENIICYIDMTNGSIEVEFTGHEYLGPVEGPDDECDSYIDSWSNFVDSGILLEGETCEKNVYYSKLRNSCLGAYVCLGSDNSPADERSGIQDLATEEWLVTCFEGNGEQGLSVDDSIHIDDQKELSCSQVIDEIENTTGM